MTKRIYDAEWPDRRLRVDVSAYANFRAGYTAAGHIMIFASDPGNQSLYGLETLFHEAQHAPGVRGHMRDELAQAFTAIGKGQPANLSHAIIFATAGAFTQPVAAAEGLPAHTPYWIREGFGELTDWGALIPIVDEHWLPVISDDAERQEAIDAMVDAIWP